LLSNPKFSKPLWNPSRTDMLNDAHELLSLDVHDVSLLLVMRQSESSSCRLPIHTRLQLTVHLAVHSDTLRWVMRGRLTFVCRRHEISFRLRGFRVF
jgi:hypothetical protein